MGSVEVVATRIDPLTTAKSEELGEFVLKWARGRMRIKKRGEVMTLGCARIN